jgi:hypothetical protein
LFSRVVEHCINEGKIIDIFVDISKCKDLENQSTNKKIENFIKETIRISKAPLYHETCIFSEMNKSLGTT